jgi:murein DD-endopeptidase MepM/ murein hydrolase activator NlpD
MHRIILFLFWAVVVVTAAESLRALSDAQAWSRLTLPYRLARLQLQPAEPVLVMPVAGVSPDRVGNTWHAPRSGGRRHEGQDIFAPRGTQVVAAAGGIVTRISDRVLGGKSVFIFGRGGRTYFYTHLNGYTPELRVGQSVEQGDVLGYVGNSGNARSTPPHLHFGLYGLRGAIDPLPLLTASADSLPEL